MSQEQIAYPESMRAAVFQDKFHVKTVTKATPQITHPADAIVKVKYSGLCGSDLHYYRGHIPSKTGHTMGHEFVGTVVAVGDGIDHDAQFGVGDDVISTFTIQCGQCWYCNHGYSGTCDKTNTFGKIGLEGGQAQYVKVPFAANTLVRKPDNHGEIDDSIYVLMADIFVTGYFGVNKILNFLKNESSVQQTGNVSVLQLGAGPVGLCSIAILRHFGFKQIVCIDSVPERLAQAKALGATTIINYETETEALSQYIEKDLSGLGFDAVLEIVGASGALRSAFDSVRRNGFIASVGMGHEPLPFTGLECYAKSVTLSFGRCHAWSLFGEALQVFESLKGDLSSLIDKKPSIDEAEEYYKLFEQHKVGKVVFDFTK